VRYVRTGAGPSRMSEIDDVVGIPDIGDSGSFIAENVGTAIGLADLGFLDIEFSQLDGAVFDNLSDSANFAPLSEIWVTKNILVWAVELNDQAGLNSFTQPILVAHHSVKSFRFIEWDNLKLKSLR